MTLHRILTLRLLMLKVVKPTKAKLHLATCNGFHATGIGYWVLGTWQLKI